MAEAAAEEAVVAQNHTRLEKINRNKNLKSHVISVVVVANEVVHEEEDLKLKSSANEPRA